MSSTVLLVVIVVGAIVGIAIVSCIITTYLLAKKRKAEDAAAAAADGNVKRKKLTKAELNRRSVLKGSDRAEDIELGDIKIDMGDRPRTRFSFEQRNKLQEDSNTKKPRRTAAEDPQYVLKIREQRRRELQRERKKLASAPAVKKGGGDDPDASEEEVEWETGSESEPSTMTSRGSSATTSESSIEEGACTIA